MRTRLAISLVVTLLTAPALAEPILSVNASSQASLLVLDGQGSTTTRIVKVADVSVIALGSLKGFKLTLTPAPLRNAANKNSISYQVVTVPSGAPTPTAADFTTAVGAPFILNRTLPSTYSGQIYIRYTAAVLQDPGTYLSSLLVAAVDNPLL